MTYQLKNILIGLLPLDEGCSSNTAAVLFGVGLAHRFGADVTFQTFVPRASAPYSALERFPIMLHHTLRHQSSSDIRQDRRDR